MVARISHFRKSPALVPPSPRFDPSAGVEGSATAAVSMIVAWIGMAATPQFSLALVGAVSSLRYRRCMVA